MFLEGSPDCGRQINIFGESRLDKVAAELELPVLDRLPVDPELSRLCDEGRLEDLTTPYLVAAAEMLDAMFN
ncbi:MAG: Mrp/NBP35 family ATP-binding protein [Firmicutes bacterium]|nr:Mrp/NBP35 family ATP-binding protein [Bacillota bacterium]